MSDGSGDADLGLDFSYIVSSVEDKTKEKAIDTEVVEMRRDFDDMKSIGHDAVVGYDSHLRNGGCDISFGLLEMDADDVSDALALRWRWLFPISLCKCIEVYKLARHVPKTVVMTKVFIGGYDRLSVDETDFVDIVFDYGHSSGLIEVSGELYEGAKSGDPRAVKMYLEMMGLLNQEEDAEAALKKLMRVQINI